MGDQTLFDSSWPRYAIAGHRVFWAASSLLVAGCIGAFAGLISGQTFVWLFWSELAASFLLGMAAIFSGKLYVGIQVLTRTPLNGWTARAVGFFVSASAATLILFAYALSFIRGG